MPQDAPGGYLPPPPPPAKARHSKRSERLALRPATSSQPTRPAEKPAAKPAAKRFATEKTRQWMIEELKDCIDLATEYFRKVDKPSILLPNETLEDISLRFCPVTRAQMDLIKAAIADFGNGGQAVNAFAPNEMSPEETQKEAVKKKIAATPPREKAAPQRGGGAS